MQFKIGDKNKNAFTNQYLTPLHLISSLIAFLAGFSLSANAQNQQENQADNLIEFTEAITISANKMEQSILDVPSSVSVISAEQLDEKGAVSAIDVLKEVPNVTFLNAKVAGHDIVNVRGINSSTFTNNHPVVIYIDSVAHSSVYGFDASLANAAQVEVLRGASGVIYGKDAIGGVINIVSKKPENEFTAKTTLEYGKNNAALGRFNLSSALVPDALFVGLNGQFDKTDGFITNHYPNMRRGADASHDHKLGGFVLYEPNDLFRVKLNLSDEKITNRWFPIMNVMPGFKPRDYKHKHIKNASFEIEQKEQKDTNTASLSLGLTLDAVKFEAITAYRKFKVDGIYDADFSDDPDWLGLTNFMQTKQQSLSQELRLSSNNNDGLTWLLGLYVEDEKHEQGPFGMGMPNFDLATGIKLGDFAINAPSIAKSDTLALFGQVMLPLTDNLELTLGMRTQSIKKDMDLKVYNVAPANADLNTGVQIYALKGSKKWHKILPKAALNWQFAPNWMSFISIAEGYMAGGFNYFTMQGTVDDNIFRPQISKTLEGGVKGSLNNLDLAATVFYMNIDDIHMYQTNGQIYTISNAPKGRSFGAEVESRYLLASTNIELSGALGLINAKYKNKGDAHIRNQHIQDTPQQTLRLGVAYLAPNGYYARFDADTIGARYFFDSANLQFVKDSSHTILDTRFGYKASNYEVYGAISNLTSQAYATYYNGHFLALNAPRTYSLGVRYDF